MSEENRDLKTLYDEIRKTVTVNIHRDGFEAIANALYNLALDNVSKFVNYKTEILIEVIKKRIKLKGENDLDLGRIQGLRQLEDQIELEIEGLRK